MSQGFEAAANGRSRESLRARNVSRVVSRESGDLLAARKARGGDALRLYGAPFWLPPEHVLDAAAGAVHEHAAAPARGLPELRRAIAARLERDYGVSADPDREILVTNAAMHGLSIAFSTFLDPGDEAAMCSPIFFFDGSIRLAGGVPVYAETSQENAWRWDVEALARSITPRTKMLVVNSPTNPTGYVAGEADLQAIVDLARQHDLIVVSDEAYDTMLYDGARHISIAALPGARERTITVHSFTKSFAMKQWRVGYLVAPAALADSMLKILEWGVLNCNHVAQRAAQAALEGPQSWVLDIGRRYQHCRDRMVEGLRAAPGLSFSLPAGAPFLFLNVSQLGVTGEEFARLLTADCGIQAEPGGAFGSDSHVRLMFGGEDETLDEAARRITATCERLSARN